MNKKTVNYTMPNFSHSNESTFPKMEGIWSLLRNSEKIKVSVVTDSENEVRYFVIYLTMNCQYMPPPFPVLFPGINPLLIEIYFIS